MRKSNFMKKTHLFLSILLFLGNLNGLFAQKEDAAGTKNAPKLSIQGRVVEEGTDDPLAYVTVQFNDGQNAVLTDINGFFKISSNRKPTLLKVSYLGFLTQNLPVAEVKKSDLVIKLAENTTKLAEITIRPKKYSRKNNPAVDLIEQVFLHKDENRKEGLAYFQFEKYEKLRMDLNGITPKFRRKWYFRPFPFLWNFCDTNEINQRVSLPYYLRERSVQSFYRRDPKGKKERLLGERQEMLDADYDIDQDGISAQLSALYSDIDIYEPSILLIDREFIGPLSGAANAFYRFYITDTTVFEGEKFANVFFAPKNKSDLAFMGTLQVALDGTYAVRRVDMGITKDANLNFVSDCRIQQSFEWMADSTGSRRLLLAHDVVTMDFKMLKFKQGRSLGLKKTAFYHDWRLNEPLPDTLFSGKQSMLPDSGNVRKRDSLFWEKTQIVPLDSAEIGVGEMYRQLQDTRVFKVMAKTGMVLGTGYYRFGKIELGELGSAFSFNDLEGIRLRLGLRTNRKFSQRWQMTTYGAYGLGDLTWKGGASTTIALPGARYNRFPNNQFRFSYEHDLRLPGFAPSDQVGTFFSSFQRGETDKLLLNRIARAEYTREWQNHFTVSTNYQRRQITGAGALFQEPTGGENPTLVTSELGGYLRFAPNETFYQGAVDRYATNNKWPVFLFQWKIGMKNVLGGDYGFQRAALRVDKTFYLKMLGRSYVSAEAGRIFGQLSYPLLEAAAANQSYFFSSQAFNLMNYLEFVSDKYATFYDVHDFGGILFNRVPVLRKLKLREAASFKLAWGGLDKKNAPGPTNTLLPFPAGTFSLGKTPYSEVSAGISNLFGVVRVEYIWRLSYLKNPGATSWGIRASAGFGF